MAAESRIDPMHQFTINPLAGNLDGSPFVFTNSALWMFIVLALIWLFMLGGMKRQLVPGRWQAIGGCCFPCCRRCSASWKARAL